MLEVGQIGEIDSLSINVERSGERLAMEQLPRGAAGLGKRYLQDGPPLPRITRRGGAIQKADQGPRDRALEQALVLDQLNEGDRVRDRDRVLGICEVSVRRSSHTQPGQQAQ